MRLILALFSGALFGAGLLYSGMANPARVTGFLDVFGRWDPTLAFVMMGAIVPMTLAWFVQRSMSRPLVEDRFSLPEKRELDAPLAIGAIIFGAGWGLTGICPGPAVANLGINPLAILPFVLAMIAGMAVHHLWARRSQNIS
ncbi:YeeE/YedE family protein [Sphingopyxis yananensis]|uniref:YeeE/YedE family protein n=1 Tax=Sphingopyxis yananensis TaxID=2886687 RepID=UPI001D10EEEB|nr:YeeE/YedE family protein [Sphingopyxis yananensis]MCC2603612.1 YeeE/YedE family protein [Sphingopyxis yananensis]